MFLVRIKPMGWILIACAVGLAVMIGFFLPHLSAHQSTVTPPVTSASSAEKPSSATAPAFSKGMQFVHVSASHPAIQGALAANDLDNGEKVINKPISFVGVVSAIYSPAGNSVTIMNFAKNYKEAFSAAIQAENYKDLPDPHELVGKKILVHGTMINFNKHLEIQITSVNQIQIVD